MAFSKRGFAVPHTPTVELTFGAFQAQIEQEFLDKSAIVPSLFEATVNIVRDTEQLSGYEASYPIHDHLNWKISRFGQKSRETQFAALLMNENGTCWQAKLAYPRWDSQKGKHMKYETPVGNGSKGFLPVVPAEIRQRISARYGVNVPLEGSFWQWLVDQPDLPIVLTEGGKKALCLLSLGYVAIALYGVHGGYLAKDQFGNAKLRELIPDIAQFAGAARPIVLAFDQDEKQSTRETVGKALSTFGRLLAKANSDVLVAAWKPEQGKGVDDLVVQCGADTWQVAYKTALPLNRWETWSYSQLSYPSQLVVNRRHLGELEVPAFARLVGLKSPKGTGKTESIIPFVAAATYEGQRVLILTHRVQLGQALCERFGVPYVTELRDAETGAMLGYGLCVDSLHSDSQARFNAEDWKDALIIIDECEQVIWHLLNAKTEVRQRRITILQQLKILLQNTLRPEGTGRVILSDADLSDLSINFVKGLAGTPDLEPWIVLNQWKPEIEWNVYHYEQPTPQWMLCALLQDILKGNKPLIQVSGQKAGTKWGTRSLERFLHKQFPELRILRIDSETIADPTHPAYGCIAKLNEILQNFDIVIASPSIETGVSIDITGHFDSVWGIFQGLAPTDTVRQALARLREPVPRHLWVATTGAIGMIGNGATSYSALLKGNSQPVQATLKVLRRIDSEIARDLQQPDPIATETWAKMAIRINAGMYNYRATILQGLADEGHTLIPVELEITPLQSQQMQQQYETLKTEAAADHAEECEATAAAEELTPAEAEKLQSQKARTPLERRKLRKYQIKQKYQVPVTAELVAKDDAGWYSKIRLHYYLTVGRDYLHSRDRQLITSAIAAGNRIIWAADLRGSLLSHQIVLLEALGILSILTPDREARNTDPDLIALAQKLKENPAQTKNLLGITINAAATPIKVLRQVLAKLGLGLEFLRKEGGYNGKGQVRVYQLKLLNDGRQQVFAAWQERDRSVATGGNLISGDNSLVPTGEKPDVVWTSADLEDIRRALAAAETEEEYQAIEQLYPPEIVKQAVA